MTNNIDYYGFDQETNKKKKISTLKSKMTFYLWFIIIFFFIIYISLSILAVWISWNSFKNNPNWIKISRTILAAMFSPIYLFYIFVRSVIFQLPN